MRTKQYLAALCLPLAFAACSDEEYVTDSPLLGSRGTINVTLNATKPGFDDVNTRIVMDGDNFKWEKDVDMIGAAMVDHATAGTVDNDIRVNYPFTAQSSAATSAFNSKSAISGGLYLFYYSYADHLTKGGLDMSVPAQKYDVALASAKDGKDAKQQAVGYMKMISPIVDLSKGVKYEDAQDYNLNLSFVNLYTMAKVIISSKNIKEGTTPKLKKVTLNASAGQGFVKTATADMGKIADKTSGNANVVTLDETTQQIKDMEQAIEAIEKLVGGAADNNPSTIYASSGRTQGAAELSIEGDLALSESAETEVYILVPKGKYNQGLILTVETTEGVYTKTISKPKTGDLILANQIQQMSADLDFSKDVEAPKNFSIGSTDDWNNAIEFINTHTGSYLGALPTFNLTKDVTIASLPTYAVKVKADAAKTLTFTEDFTLAKGGKMLDADGGSSVTLCVASGATLTLNDASGFAIQNNGTLNVNATQTKKITNLGTMNVGGEAAVSLPAGLDNGKEAVVGPPAAAAIEGIINIPEGKSLTITTVALENKVGTITVDGTLTISYASTNSDKIIVDAKGTLTGAQSITNNGTIENSGKLTISAAMANEHGTFVIKKDSKGGNSSGAINKGTVIVETGVKLPEAGDAYAFGASADAPVVSTEVTNAEEYAAVKDVATITNIILSKQAEWTIGGSGLAAPSATSLTLKGVKLIVGAEMTDKNIIVEGGASTITAASALSIKGNVALTVKQGAALTVEKNVTFNEAKNNIAEGAKATILGTLKVEAGAVLYFNTATVGSEDVADATLTVAGNITTGGTVAGGVFGVYLNSDATKFKNWGTISSLTGEGDGADNAGKISAAQPQSETAVAKGLGSNATVAFNAPG